MLRKTLILLCSTLIFNAANAQTTGTYITITVPLVHDTLNVCKNTIPVKIILHNDSAVTVTNIAVEHKMQEGIYFAGTFAGADSVNNTVPNRPVFYIDSLAPYTTDTLIFSIAAGCGYMAKTSSIKDTTTIFYKVNQNAFTQFKPNSSYNMAYPSVYFMGITPPDAIPANVGDEASNTGNILPRIIDIRNGGLGVVDTLKIKIIPEPEIHHIGFYSIPPYSYPIPFTRNADGSISITLAGINIYNTSNNNGPNDSLFENNEDIFIVEHFTVTSCSPSTQGSSYQTWYTTSWNCGGQTCQTDTAYANVNVQAGLDVKIACRNYSNPAKTYFNSSNYGTTEFMYKHTGSNLSIFGDAMATNIQFALFQNATAAGIQAIRISNIPIDSIAGLKYTVKDTVIYAVKYKAYIFC